MLLVLTLYLLSMLLLFDYQLLVFDQSSTDLYVALVLGLQFLLHYQVLLPVELKLLAVALVGCYLGQQTFNLRPLLE